MIVDLPPPDGPTTPTCSPGCRSRSKSWRRGRSRRYSKLTDSNRTATLSDQDVRGVGHVHDLRSRVDQGDQLRCPAQTTRQVPDLHEALDELLRHLRGVEQHQVDHAGPDIAVNGEDDPDQERTPGHEAHGPAHPDTGDREHPPRLQVGAHRVAEEVLDPGRLRFFACPHKDSGDVADHVRGGALGARVRSRKPARRFCYRSRALDYHEGEHGGQCHQDERHRPRHDGRARSPRSGQRR